MNADTFLAAIRAQPEDDLHRLVFADWLEEHGQSDRAEFIRLQCRQAGMEEFAPERQDMDLREQELLVRHHRDWVGELPEGVDGWRFHRGFVDELTLPAPLFTAEWESLLSQHPVTNARLLQEPDFSVHELAECPGLERLRVLDLRGWDLDELDPGTKLLLTSPRLRNLRRMNLADCGLCYVGGEYLANNPALAGLRELDFTWAGQSESDGENVLACLTDSKCLTSLESLRMFDSRNNPDVLLSLNDAPFRESLRVLDRGGNDWYEYDAVVGRLRLPQLHSMSLHGSTVMQGGASSLLDSPLLPSIKRLNLSLNHWNWAEWGTPPQADALLRSLLRAGGWSRLESLVLQYAHVTPAGIRDLVATPSNLRQLDLSHNPLAQQGLIALAECPWLSSLSFLDLSATDADDDSVARLAASPGLANIRVLGLGENKNLTAHGIEALTRSPHLGQLRALRLGYTSAAGIQAEWFGRFPRLRELVSPNTGSSAKFAQDLAKCPWLARLQRLDLGNNQIGSVYQKVLLSPYLSPLCVLSAGASTVGRKPGEVNL